MRRGQALSYRESRKRKILFIVLTGALSLVLFFFSLFAGSSSYSFSEMWNGLFGNASGPVARIMRQIRLPRVVAAYFAGAGLALSGLIMQTTLGNIMASPSTLGVSNAAVFGANLMMILLAGGFTSFSGNVNSVFSTYNPYLISMMAFVFSALSTLAILGLGRIRSFSPSSLVLSGIALGVIWNAGTTLLEYFATDIGLSAMVMWSFGDLSRATWAGDYLLIGTVLAGFVLFFLLSWKYNALLAGETYAESLGVKVKLLRFVSLLYASLITALVVSFYGIIGFVGIICPHVMKRFLGNDHRLLIPASFFSGTVLLVLSDTLSRTIGRGASLPVGAITAMLGAPFFLYILFTTKESQI